MVTKFITTLKVCMGRSENSAKRWRLSSVYSFIEVFHIDFRDPSTQKRRQKVLNFVQCSFPKEEKAPEFCDAVWNNRIFITSTRLTNRVFFLLQALWYASKKHQCWLKHTFIIIAMKEKAMCCNIYWSLPSAFQIQCSALNMKILSNKIYFIQNTK